MRKVAILGLVHAISRLQMAVDSSVGIPSDGGANSNGQMAVGWVFGAWKCEGKRYLMK